MKKTMHLILSLSLILCSLLMSLPTANAAGLVFASEIVDNAKSLVDKYPYVWGGESPAEGGFDCSGLVWYVYNQMSGVDISLEQAGRSKSALAGAGEKINNISDFLPGDIVQFEYAHVAIYIGDNTIVEAPGEGMNIKYTKIGANSRVAYAVRLDRVVQGPQMIGYRRADVFEYMKEYPAEHIYYFKGVNETLWRNCPAYIKVAGARTVIYDHEHDLKEIDVVDKLEFTTLEFLDILRVYHLSDDYELVLIYEEENVEAGKTYNFNDKGMYEVVCNDRSVGSINVVSADELYPIRDMEEVMYNPRHYIPMYTGEEGSVLTSDSVLASPTDSELIVEKSSWAMNAYNIGGNNYFKLRDLAFAFTFEGTDRPFDVTWDGEKNAINIITNCEYTAVGGECGGYNLQTGELPPPKEYSDIKEPQRVAVPTTSEIYIDGNKANLTAYHIGGNNYFKLRDLAQALNFQVNWDAENNMIFVSTYGSYQPE